MSTSTKKVKVRAYSGKTDMLIIALVAILLVAALIFVLLQIVGHSEEHVEKVRKTKVAYAESLRWRPELQESESLIRDELNHDPNREKANYSDRNLNETCFQLIGRMSRLQELKLTRSTLRDDWLKHVEHLPVRSVGLHGTPITDRAIPHLLKLRNLTHLELGDTEVTDKGLALLSESRSILDLDLSVGRCITNAGIKHVGRMKQLVRLNLADSKNIDAKCLPVIRDLQDLRSRLIREQLPVPHEIGNFFSK